MSTNWIKDIKKMHSHYGVKEAFLVKLKSLNEDQGKAYLKALLLFRVAFLGEELQELMDSNEGEDVTDALIDLCVVALGTLDLFNADAGKAWDEVLRANMEKEVGIKPSRPNPWCLPDLIKPEGWVGPDHTGLNGLFEQLNLPL
jgi:predicted HAD superfamily Cof-like phosphohydrolase